MGYPAKEIDAILEKQRHCERLLSAYDLVLEDLSDWDEDEWRYVRGRVEFMRADIDDAVDEHKKRIDHLRSKCSHALERIGEARPPYLHCVTCGYTEPSRSAP